jgi:hypothetical protein
MEFEIGEGRKAWLFILSKKIMPKILGKGTNIYFIVYKKSIFPEESEQYPHNIFLKVLCKTMMKISHHQDSKNIKVF